MEILKVHFGSQRPNSIDFRKQADGFAEVWLYKDIHEETAEDGTSEYVADGVFFRTMLSEEEIEQRKDEYFKNDSEPQAEERIAELEKQNEMLTECLFELASIIYA